MKSAEKTNNLMVIDQETIIDKIFVIRKQKVMLDRDLAALYGVSTKRLNEQVKRNRKRFPDDFMFRLSGSELDELVANCDRLNALKHSSNAPLAFTEHGIAMLSTALNSEKAIQVNIAIIRAFVRMRKIFMTYKELADKVSEIDIKTTKHGKDILMIFSALNRILKEEEKPKKKFGFV